MTPFTTHDDGVVLPADIAFAAFLGGLTTGDVITAIAPKLSLAEIALMSLPTGSAA